MAIILIQANEEVYISCFYHFLTQTKVDGELESKGENMNRIIIDYWFGVTSFDFWSLFWIKLIDFLNR